MKKILLIIISIINCSCSSRLDQDGCEYPPPNPKSSNLSQSLIRQHGKEVYETLGGSPLGIGGGVTGKKLRLASASYNLIMEPTLPLARLLMVVYPQKLFKMYLTDEMKEYLLEGFGVHSIYYKIFFYDINQSLSSRGVAIASIGNKSLLYKTANYYEDNGELIYSLDIPHEESYEEALEIIKRDFPEIFSGEEYDFNELMDRALTLPSPLESDQELIEEYKKYFKENPNRSHEMIDLKTLRKQHRKRSRKRSRK